MKKLFLSILIIMSAALCYAQEETRPVRTPEEEARKQTEMLERELNLTAYQYDTIYRIHLKYANLRRVSNTRQEILERMTNMTNELVEVMTPKQRELFLNRQMGVDPRRPQPRVGRLCHDSVDGGPVLVAPR